MKQMTDYTEQIVAACADALQRFPDMPEPLRDGMLEFILTGKICHGDRMHGAVCEENVQALHLRARQFALLRAMPSLKPDCTSWRKHLQKYYEYVEEYEQLKNTENP